MVKKTSLINTAYKLLNNSYNVKTNVIKVSAANTFEHELAKFIKAYQLIDDGHTIITEAIFKNGTRADILVLNTLQVYEILHSETEQMAEEKIKKYPEEVEIFLLRSGEVIKCQMKEEDPHS